MKAPLALTLAALASATTMSHAQVSTFSYVGEVIEINDGLNLFGSAAEGSEGSGIFTLDLDADAVDNPMGGDFTGYFIAQALNAAMEDYAISGTSPDDLVFAFATNDLTYNPVDEETGEIFDEITVDVLEISLSPSGSSSDYDFGGVSIILTGTPDWFDSAGETIPDPLSMGFENLLSAEVVIEFFQLQGGGGGGDAPGDGDGGDGGTMVSSRAVINITSMANADGTVATIGCRSFQFAAPVAVFNFSDVSTYINAFAAQSADADLNNDGLYNFLDISTFLGMAQTSCSN